MSRGKRLHNTYTLIISQFVFFSFSQEKQVIRQFHYTAWPDHGRPTSATPIIRMIEMFREHRKRHDIPFVIHCSAGCGRTGTIIAIDFARTMLMSKVCMQRN